MLKKRPCRICRRRFRPDPRAGDRQRVWSSADCQRERHRRSDRAWHARHPDYDRDRRLRERLQVDEAAAMDRPEEPLAGPARPAAQDAVDLEVLVVIEVLLRLARVMAQGAVAAQGPGITTKSRRLPTPTPQDETARPRVPT